MEGFNGDGNDGHQFNYDGYTSDFGHTRDFLSQPPAFFASGAYTFVGAPPPGFPSSSNPTPSQLRLDSLDLNVVQSWANMHTYQGILQSGAQDGGSGSFAPIPCACLHAAAGVPWACARLAGPLVAVVPGASLLVNVAPHPATLAVPGVAVHVAARNRLPTTRCILLKSRYTSIPINMHV
jgi:hypothetical protein